MNKRKIPNPAYKKVTGHTLWLCGPGCYDVINIGPPPAIIDESNVTTPDIKEALERLKSKQNDRQI